MGTYPVSHYGPPVMNITQLDDVVRKEFYEKKGVVLGTDVYKVYIVGGLANVSAKTTAEMRLLVTPPEESLKFYPVVKPNPEKRLIHLFTPSDRAEVFTVCNRTTISFIFVMTLTTAKAANEDRLERLPNQF